MKNRSHKGNGVGKKISTNDMLLENLSTKKKQAKKNTQTYVLSNQMEYVHHSLLLEQEKK